MNTHCKITKWKTRQYAITLTIALGLFCGQVIGSMAAENTSATAAQNSLDTPQQATDTKSVETKEPDVTIGNLQQGIALDLVTCMRLADKKHPDIGPAKARIQHAEAMIDEAASGLFPVIKYQGGYHHNFEAPGLEGYQLNGMPGAVDLQFQGKDVWQAEAGIAWQVFNWNRVQNRKKSAQYELTARQNDYVRVRERIINNVIQAYWTLASAKEARQFLDVTLHELGLFLEMCRIDQKNGLPNVQEKDVIQISIDINKMQAWRGTLDRWAETARQALAIAIDQPESPVRIKETRVRFNPVRIKFNESLEFAFSYRSDLKAMDDRVREAELQISIEDRANWPTVSLFGKGYVQEDNFDPSQSANGMVGVVIQGTLFDGFNASAKSSAAKAKLLELKAERYKLRQEIRQEVNTAYLQVREAYTLLKSYKDARARTMEKLDLVRQGYPLQKTDVKDVLETQVERRWRDADYIFAKLSLVKAMAALNYACGAAVYDFSIEKM